MILIEGKHGLPVAEAVFPGNWGEKSAVEPTLDQSMKGLVKPQNILGDAEFSSRPLTRRLWCKYKIHLNAPPKRHYVHFFHDGRRIRRIKRRWKVERCFAWLRSHRRLETRWEIYGEYYLGFVQLACIMILIKYLF